MCLCVNVICVVRLKSSDITEHVTEYPSGSRAFRAASGAGGPNKCQSSYGEGVLSRSAMSGFSLLIVQLYPDMYGTPRSTATAATHKHRKLSSISCYKNEDLLLSLAHSFGQVQTQREM